MTSPSLTLYTNPQSRGRITRWMLEEVGQPYEVVTLAYGSGLKSPTYLALNPMGKVPALRHGEVIVTETAAICAFLADAFPTAGLAPPPASPLRGAYYRWLFFAAGPLEAALSNKALGFVVPPEREVMMGYGRYDTAIDTLEGAVKAASPFLLGTQFSAADVYVGSHVLFGLQFGTLDKRPAFVDYAARLSARAAYQRANNLDNAMMAAKG